MCYKNLVDSGRNKKKIDKLVELGKLEKTNFLPPYQTPPETVRTKLLPVKKSHGIL